MTLQELISNIPDGVYPAKATGYHSEFTVVIRGHEKKYCAKFNVGVKGMDITNNITISDDKIYSDILGGNGVLVSLE